MLRTNLKINHKISAENVLKSYQPFNNKTIIEINEVSPKKKNL
jgi:hypothetical protein